MVVEVAVIKDVCSSCSIKSVSSCFSERSSGLVVVKVTGLLEKVSSCSKVVEVDVVKVVSYEQSP